MVRSRRIGDLIDVTYAAASNLIKRLTTVGVLAEITGQTRNRRFRYDPYIALFAEDENDRREGQSSTDRSPVRRPKNRRTRK